MLQGLGHCEVLRCHHALLQTLLHPGFSATELSSVEAACTSMRTAIAEGGDPAWPSEVGYNALMIVILCSQPRVARAILEELDPGKKERVLQAKTPSGLTAMMWAKWLSWVTQKQMEEKRKQKGQECQLLPGNNLEDTATFSVKDKVGGTSEPQRVHKH